MLSGEITVNNHKTSLGIEIDGNTMKEKRRIERKEKKRIFFLVQRGFFFERKAHLSCDRRK
jgi:hypothetical protein